MNRSELLRRVSEDTHIDKSLVTLVCDSLFDTITETIKEGDHVTITGFGRFEMRNRKPRKFTNPKTGASMSLQGSCTPGFTPSNSMKKAARSK